MRLFWAFCALLLLPSVSFAASIEGRVVSVDTTYRQLTMETGEILTLTESVAMTEVVSGQIVRADCEDGTVNVVSIQLLEPAPPPPTLDEPILEE